MRSNQDSNKWLILPILKLKFFQVQIDMCFSATACFTAGAILLPTGAYTLGKAYQCDKRYLALAAFPLMFGLQQIIEGKLWLALDQRVNLSIEMAAIGFLFFAYFLWPFCSFISIAC